MTKSLLFKLTHYQTKIEIPAAWNYTRPSKEQLAEILRLHGDYLYEREGGRRADLRGADLSGAVLPDGVLWQTYLDEAFEGIRQLFALRSTPRETTSLTPEDVTRWMDERGYYSVASVGIVTLPDYDGDEGISFERDSLTETCELADRFMNDVPCLDDVGAVECERLVNEWLLANDPRNFAASSQGVPSTKGEVTLFYESDVRLLRQLAKEEMSQRDDALRALAKRIEIALTTNEEKR